MTEDLQPLIDKVRPLTMVPDESLAELACQVRLVLEQGIPGDFVECGSWRGGAAFLMAELVREAGADRTTWLFDSFEGIPPPEPVDGAAALAWAADTDGPVYFDNLRASVGEVSASAAAAGARGPGEAREGHVR